MNDRRETSSMIKRMIAASCAAALALLAPLAPLHAQDDKIHFVRIGTGATGGSLFPLGGLIANAISNPPGSRPCDKGGSCGVPGMIAVAQSTGGSVDNLRAVRDGGLDLGLVQANVAFSAHAGSGPFKGEPPATALRAIAVLFSEDLHVVARRGAGVKSVADLKGRTVSLGEPGSGTRVDAIAVINAVGVLSSQVKDQAAKSGQAADLLAAGKLDAFFETAVTPSATVAALAEKGAVDLLPLPGAAIDVLTKRFSFLYPGVIPAGAYPGLEQSVPTLRIPIVLIARADMPDETAKGIARAIWHPNSARLFRNGHPGGKFMSLADAALDVGIPLHPGARQYYEEAAAQTAPPPPPAQ